MSLTDILIENNIVSPEDLDQAIERRAALGGSLEDHLYRLKIVDEISLCLALEEATGRRMVPLGEFETTPELLNTIPAELALRYTVLPVSTQDGRVVFACLNPDDEIMLKELTDACAGREVELAGAVPAVLGCRVLECYRGSVPAPSGEESPARDDRTNRDRSVILIGTFSPRLELLGSLLAAEGHYVILADNAEEVMPEIEQTSPTAVLVFGRPADDYRVLVDRIRKISPSCRVRFMGSVSEFITGESQGTILGDLLTSTLHMSLSMMSSDEELASEDIGRIGELTDRICSRLGLPVNERMLVVNAAYLLELAAAYLGDIHSPDFESDFTRGLEEGAGEVEWPPVLIDILRHKDTDVNTAYPDRLPLAILGGNILRIAKDYCSLQPAEEPLTIERLGQIKDRLRGRTGKHYLREVVDALMAELFSKVVYEESSGPTAHVLLYNESGNDTLMLEPCLTHLGYNVTGATNLDELARSYERDWPDILIVLAPGESDETAHLMRKIVGRGIVISKIPTFLMPSASSMKELSYLLSEGIEDIVPLDGDLDPLLIKMSRVRRRQEDDFRRRLSVMQQMGTHGTLEDMNVIDLLQAIGHTQKTVRISVTGHGSQLEMFIHQGRLIYAESDSRSGADAIYGALRWEHGIWSVDPIDDGDLPQPNNEQSIDSILIEGCHLMDEAREGDKDVGAVEDAEVSIDDIFS